MTGTAIKTDGEGCSSSYHLNLTVALGQAPKHPNGPRWNKGAAKPKIDKSPRIPEHLRDEYRKMRRKVGSVEAAKALGLSIPKPS